MSVQYNFKRYEKKYWLTEAQAALFLQRARPFITPDRFPTSKVCNIYYDTPNFALIRASVEKPPYKEKLRVRSYGTPGEEDDVFIEIKKKYKGIVYKRRMTQKACRVAEQLACEGNLPVTGQIAKEIAWFQHTYQSRPTIFIGYDRTSFAGTDQPALRITFDRNIRWRDQALDLRQGDYGALLLPNDPVLMEIKIPGAGPLWLSRLLSELSLFPTSFSKYGYCYKNYILPQKKEALFSA